MDLIGGEIVPTHGALSKAGKVRMQTPKIDVTSKNSSSGPRVNNRKLYHNRVELCRNIGQFKMDSYRRR
jgi:ribosomal protein S30